MNHAFQILPDLFPECRTWLGRPRLDQSHLRGVNRSRKLAANTRHENRREVDMNESLRRLIALASKVEMTAEERERQRRSFAYGSARIENDRITQELVDEIAEKVRPEPPEQSDGRPV
jgi:Fic family protein